MSWAVLSTLFFFVDALPDRVRPLVLDVLDVICDYSTRSFCPDEMKRRRDFYSKHPEGMFLDGYFVFLQTKESQCPPYSIAMEKVGGDSDKRGLA